MLVAIPSLSFLAVFGFGCLFWFVCFVFWVVLFLMGLLTGLCIGPLPALLRLLIQLTALQANYNSACLLRLNVCNDLAKAMKALDGKKVPTIRVGFWMLGQKLQAVRGHCQH